MDKSWMAKSRLSKEYELGVETFIESGLCHAKPLNTIRCPCLKCGNLHSHNPTTIRTHLYINGIDQSYKVWYWHGEDLPSEKVNHNEPYNEFDEKFGEEDFEDVIEMVQVAQEQLEKNSISFETMFSEAQKPLYVGCKKYTKLSSLVRLYNLKVRFGWSDNSFSELLSIVSDLLPKPNEMPISMYEAKKTLRALGLTYEKIHACPKHCCLYRKEYSEAVRCPICGTSRWKSTKNSQIEKKGVPAKQIWYFPIIPRLKRLFRSVDHAKNLIWHATSRKNDGILRHPSDSPSWRLVDHLWPDFGSEPRNIRLALSADGVNPYGDLSSKYSCWPVLLSIYNLPPWLCMKRKFLMLSLLISGPKQSGYDINVYLAPLVDDLNLLWEIGVECYDAFKKETFNLKAILLWTINDFPAYGNLCGCTVKGFQACPICAENTSSLYLTHGKKMTYMRHRRFLPRHHPYRKQKKAFDGNTEHDSAPQPLSGEAIYMKINEIEFSSIKKHVKKRYWKRKSIFFELPYWHKLHVRHCLDVMHIEKNVCMNIIGTLLDIPGKSKDGVSARFDLVKLNIRTELAPRVEKKRTYLPPACYTLTKEEKRRVCKTLSEIKVPEGYSSNIRNLVSMEDVKLNGLKSHDCHVLMQQLLPVALRSVLPKHVRYAIIRMCFFFNAICSKSIRVAELDKLQEDIVVTLCLFEKYFPPSFFTIMLHLTVHLVREIKLCGPVYLRWMYPFERYMKVLKSYVRNRHHPEGCISEAYVVEEAVEFCSEFLSDIEPVGLGLYIKKELEYNQDRPLSAATYSNPSKDQLQQAHRYILENTDDVQPYIQEHMEFLKAQNSSKSNSKKWLQDEHNRSFGSWLRDRVVEQLSSVDNNVTQTLRWVAHGPHHDVRTYEGYLIQGRRYHTKSRDNMRTVQNSGVSLVATTMQVASSKDKKPITTEMTFYGVIQEIWEVNYNTFTVIMFKCDWVESKNGVQKDDLGFTLVDFSRIGHKNDSFILASQAKQVFYIEDSSDRRWSVVLSPPDREYIDENDDDDDASFDCPPPTKFVPEDPLDDLDEDMSLYMRDDCDGTWIIDS